MASDFNQFLGKVQGQQGEMLKIKSFENKPGINATT